MNRHKRLQAWTGLYLAYAGGVFVGTTRSPSYSFIADAGLGVALLVGLWVFVLLTDRVRNDR